jgi:hypothetical protein
LASSDDAAGGHGQLDSVTAHALADAQVDDRHVVDRLAVEDQDVWANSRSATVA